MTTSEIIEYKNSTAWLWLSTVLFCYWVYGVKEHLRYNYENILIKTLGIATIEKRVSYSYKSVLILVD